MGGGNLGDEAVCSKEPKATTHASATSAHFLGVSGIGTIDLVPNVAVADALDGVRAVSRSIDEGLQQTKTAGTRQAPALEPR